MTGNNSSRFHVFHSFTLSGFYFPFGQTVGENQIWEWSLEMRIFGNICYMTYNILDFVLLADDPNFLMLRHHFNQGSFEVDRCYIVMNDRVL